MKDGSEDIVDRRMVLCERLQTSFDINELITHCLQCHRFFVLCCQHLESDTVCHHHRLVFTDGSCLNNGKIGATAGIGVAIGTVQVVAEHLCQWSIPVDNTIDAYPKRTSQRAELLAALEGLRKISMADSDENDERHTAPKHRGKEAMCWVIATDSEYVVKGMTEWLPVWKENNWRTARGSSPSNLDLFRRLDSMISEQERKYRVKIEFWRIPREINELADSLARRAARSAATE